MSRARAVSIFRPALLCALLSIGAVAPARAATSGDALRAEIAAAAPGATVRVKAGIYDGPFVIEKSLHLLGENGAVLRGDGVVHVIAVQARDVEIGGFSIRRSGRNLFNDTAAVYITADRAFIHDNRISDMLHGIYVRKAHDCRIQHNVILGDGARDEVIADPVTAGLRAADAAAGDLCSVPDPLDRRGNGIHLWNSSGHRISGNRIRGTRDGIYFSFTNDTLTRDNDIAHVRYGLHYMYSDGNVFERNVFSDNAAGAALMYSKRLVLRANRFVANRSHRAYGLLLQSIDDTRIENNTIEGNTVGLFLENGNGDTIRANRIVGNYVGLRVDDSTAGSRFFENNFSGNIHPLETSGNNGANLWAVAGRGNHWDNAESLDLNRDGVADLPHHEADLFGPWRRTLPAIGLLSASPGERLLRFIHSRLALPGLPGATDPHPLVAAPITP
ncbi:right-handed parallel beta-helix repeat-containing protein [Horticoccus luteus]|uniref:Right-handed parallel beta-helix repeat-containing protein n=1 Tax=Horticoccus luteus TaxID=2862869 RepID=A0A8F9TVK5_9BACT|nr:NosD domain-containing protein [Horticoccus luteus]QYM78867.1 right-handed parallel beta-helix repeat-containing protein [Horticoccus luteus]